MLVATHIDGIEAATASSAIPLLETKQLNSNNAGPLSQRPPPTPHLLSGRRLSKSIMRADSQDTAGSKNWGIVQIRDSTGTPRSVRVVQDEKVEDGNIVRISWFWSHDDETHQVELRHGRRSGIRKIYLDKVLLDRQKSVKNLLSDTGSRHEFQVGRQQGEILITPKGVSGFHYQLKIDGQAIEQSIQGPGQGGAGEQLDLGTRALQLPKSPDGLGMTLRNNPNGDGVVVWTIEEGKAADLAGFQIGDVVLSIEDHLLTSIDNLVEYVSQATEVINMEVAGTAQSRTVTVVKPSSKQMIGISMMQTSCGIGILIAEIDPNGCAHDTALRVGDIVLSIGDVVPANPKEAAQLIQRAEYVIKMVLVGH